MISHLKNLFTATEANSETTQSRLSLATAALMVEVMVIDGEMNIDEQQHIQQLLLEKFAVSKEVLNELIEDAKREVADATSLFQFTRQINADFSAAEKFKLLQSLWQVAYADQNLDKHEEHLIRRIADLLHIPHSEFIKAKNAARKQ